ncbi:MAG: Gfo/Idh/MocA family oxidoreductase [Actinobacteria bacterium]|nr:Gfo/Idh/MocA family oxidoreductase [Actinomycetota bacterium]
MNRASGPPGRARLAVAGLGRMGSVHAHNVARSCPSAELVAVFDPRLDLARSVGGELGARVVQNYEDLLADEDVDAVVIAAPTSAHAEMALEAGRSGKHVFCEKPLSLDRALALRVLEAFPAWLDPRSSGPSSSGPSSSGPGSSKQLCFQVGFNRRFDPAVVGAAQRVRAGELGEVLLYRASQRDKTSPAPEFIAGSGGIFVDMGIHDFDTARWLVGEVDSVSAEGMAWRDPAFAATGDYHSAVVVLRFKGGALGTIDLSRIAGYGYESSLELMGQKATVRVDDPYLARYEWREHGLASRPLVEAYHHRYSAAFAAELEGFARSVLSGVPTGPSGHDALAAFDIAQAAAESCRTGVPVAVATMAPSGPVRAADQEGE